MIRFVGMKSLRKDSKYLFIYYKKQNMKLFETVNNSRNFVLVFKQVENSGYKIDKTEQISVSFVTTLHLRHHNCTSDEKNNT